MSSDSSLIDSKILGYPSTEEINEFNKEGLTKWRDSSKCSTYLLLDSGVINKIQWDKATPDEKLKLWKNFVRSIFFVGKGQDSNSHVDKAKKAFGKGGKVGKGEDTAGNQILQIWSKGNGVIVLEASESITSEEAGRRKTVIGETLKTLKGLLSSSNKNDGGAVEEVVLDENLRFVRCLLFQAMKKFLDPTSTNNPIFAPKPADGHPPSPTAAGSSKEIKQTPPKEKDDSTEDLALSIKNMNVNEESKRSDVESKSDEKSDVCISQSDDEFKSSLSQDDGYASCATSVSPNSAVEVISGQGRSEASEANCRDVEETRQSDTHGDNKTPKRNGPKKQENESEQNNCLSPAPAVGNISARIEETTPGKSDGDQSIAGDENDDDDTNSPEEPSADHTSTRPRTRKARNDFIEERIKDIKGAMENLADENAILSSEPLTKEFLNYPGGNSKDCYTYLLLDPRVINEIKWEDATPGKKWSTFIRSIFYVGKGQNLRPYDHLQDAYKLLTTAKYVESRIKNAGKKIQRILQIWSEGEGVIIFKAFQLMISAEAHTREAVIINTLGLPSLCNKNHGTYYNEKVRDLDRDRKSSFGKYLLLQAMKEYNHSDKIKIFPVNMG
ncbi:uncharacterized protein LOC135945483 isoform X2 [Cloeon dipterum]|uniref:uncharacterized protein LOC135945483 isoform X2 n=1 Tax=Cloeon dipterum TaxID=197152 RepID=UPI00321FB1C0